MGCVSSLGQMSSTLANSQKDNCANISPKNIDRDCKHNNASTTDLPDEGKEFDSQFRLKGLSLNCAGYSKKGHASRNSKDSLVICPSFGADVDIFIENQAIYLSLFSGHGEDGDKITTFCQGR